MTPKVVGRACVGGLMVWGVRGHLSFCRTGCACAIDPLSQSASKQEAGTTMTVCMCAEIKSAPSCVRR